MIELMVVDYELSNMKLFKEFRTKKGELFDHLKINFTNGNSGLFWYGMPAIALKLDSIIPETFWDNGNSLQYSSRTKSKQEFNIALDYFKQIVSFEETILVTDINGTQKVVNPELN